MNYDEMFEFEKIDGGYALLNFKNGRGEKTIAEKIDKMFEL